ncbi:Holliday junction branch migration protein RuvA [Bacillaceae bacterium Marseille-Q3522]|nr:Holliday junction branch migration protein RuvA [Bacillaceae bacterium Marseille-Q3522]
MYEFIKGNVNRVFPQYIVIENQGIGYQIVTPNPYSYTAKFGQSVCMFTYQYVREDVIALYGFSSQEEKQLFSKLLNVSGIGPKGALAILAACEPGQFVGAIEAEDEAFLIKFPGVGKKTARQMILDLKGKLLDVIGLSDGDAVSYKQKKEKNEINANLDEAILALQALGYSEKEIKKVSGELKNDDLTTDQYIKKALKLLLR